MKPLKKLVKYAYIEKPQIYRRELMLYRALIETKLAPIAYPLEIGLWLSLCPPASIAGIRLVFAKIIFYRTLVMILTAFRSKKEEK